MITDPDAVRVLCFGDSNTYGVCRREADTVGTPTEDPDYVRLHADRRWPGALQRLLGDGYDVLEEGLNGRTTEVDDPDRPGLNGRAYFVPCLLSHQPLDVVVVMLGGNDLKPAYGRTPEAIADSLSGYVDDVAANAAGRRGQVPTTVLIGHTLVDDTAPNYRDIVAANVARELPRRVQELSTAIGRMALERGVLYVDPAPVARPGSDGIHLDMGSHTRLAELVASVILERQ